MAPLPSNSTRVHGFVYTTGRVTHRFQVRSVGATSNEDVLDGVRQFLLPLAPVLPSTWQITSAAVRQAGSNIFLPLPLTEALEDFRGTDTSPEGGISDPREFVWVGRSAGGRRCEVSLYGIQLGFVDNYRYPASAGGTPLGDARNALVAVPGAFVAIDALAVTWYPYVNVNNNSYWEGRARRGL